MKTADAAHTGIFASMTRPFSQCFIFIYYYFFLGGGWGRGYCTMVNIQSENTESIFHMLYLDIHMLPLLNVSLQNGYC